MRHQFYRLILLIGVIALAAQSLAISVPFFGSVCSAVAAHTASMVDATGTTEVTYNDAGEETDLSTPQGDLEYTYNAAGQRATMVDVGTGTTTYTYDTAGRLSTLTNPYSEVTTFTYDTLGRPSRRTLDSGTYDEYGYDSRSRVSSVATKDSGNSSLRARTYGYDDANQVTSTTVDGVTTDYDYDLAGQLTEEVRSGYDVAYTYDANGNRTSRTVNTVTETLSYDSADKLLSVSGGSDPRTFGYDAAGRTTSIVRSGGTTTLSYDYESRITSLSSSSQSLSHTYNGLDTRVATTQNSVSRTFKRDGAYVTDPVIGDGAAKYTPSISERRGSTTTFLHSGMKNADAQTNTSGSVSASRVYDAFGAELSSTGSWQGRFGYAGGFGYQEDDGGFKLLGHRYYDPSTGRFLTRDPAKDGRNWYAYCFNAPISYLDNMGEAPQYAGAAVGGGATVKGGGGLVAGGTVAAGSATVGGAVATIGGTGVGALALIVAAAGVAIGTPIGNEIARRREEAAPTEFPADAQVRDYIEEAHNQGSSESTRGRHERGKSRADAEQTNKTWKENLPKSKRDRKRKGRQQLPSFPYVPPEVPPTYNPDMCYIRPTLEFSLARWNF